MFNWTNNITLPKITDVINTSDMPNGIANIFTYIWIWFLGGWFFAIIIGVIGAALYVKYENIMVTIAWYVVAIGFLGGTTGILSVETSVPSAVMFAYVVGIFAAVGIGILLYRFFVDKNG